MFLKLKNSQMKWHDLIQLGMLLLLSPILDPSLLDGWAALCKVVRARSPHLSSALRLASAVTALSQMDEAFVNDMSFFAFVYEFRMAGIIWGQFRTQNGIFLLF